MSSTQVSSQGHRAARMGKEVRATKGASRRWYLSSVRLHLVQGVLHTLSVQAQKQLRASEAPR